MSAAAETSVHEIIAAISTYVSAALSGNADPFVPHCALLGVSIVAAFTVGGGIVLESPKYSAAAHRVATWLVLGGIAIESLCTVLLFVFDEGISSAQQRLILVATDRASDAGFDAAMANNAAGEANERAAKLEKEAAQLTVQAADANERATKAGLEILKLEASRNLDPEQSAKIVAKLKESLLPTCKISLVEPALDSSDAKPFAESIRDVFTSAGATLTPTKLNTVLSWTAPGAWLEVSRLTDVPCAAAIQRAFAAVDIYLEGVVKPGDLNDPDEVLIVVSSHPFKPVPVPDPLKDATAH